MKRKPTPAEEKVKRLKRNQKARERHWIKTGVSQATVDWMRQYNYL